MPAFVSTAKHPPPSGQSLMVRAGGSVYWAAHNALLGWRHLVPGHGEESILQPDEWWDQNANPAMAANPALVARGQFLLDLSDSNPQSRRRAA